MNDLYRTPATDPTATHAELTEHLKLSLGDKRLEKIFDYREYRRKEMLGLCQEYTGEDRKILYALGKLWLNALDHTLWNVDHRSTTSFVPELQLYDLNIVGLCYEWHDFATFAHIANKLPGYDRWAQFLEIDPLAAKTYHIRTRPSSADLLLRPTSTMFYSIAFVNYPNLD